MSERLTQTSHPLVYEVNTRLLLRNLSRTAGKPVTLGTIPDHVIEEWASLGFDAIWLMGVWTTGKIGLDIARERTDLEEEYRKVLPDYSPDDVIGSPYAVKSYSVARSLGGNLSLLALRKRLEKKGLGLILDFVCNHTARDHDWVSKNPEYYVNGIPGDEHSMPDRYFMTKTRKGEKVIAFGRDPYFPGWTDTAQLNPIHPGLRSALVAELRKIARLCDGLRCDMAMLVLQEIFMKTWGDRGRPADLEPLTSEFWEEAIQSVRRDRRDFLFVAEAYWNLEWRLQQQGFDYTYDKLLYDRLLKEGAASVYEHLSGDKSYQQHSVRFLENHDERRVADALPLDSWHYAAAVVVSAIPGMVLFHDGQLQGRRVRTPVQLGRRPDELLQPGVATFYTRLLGCLCSSVFRQGEWFLLKARSAWNENHTWQNILPFWWQGMNGASRLVVVNYAPHQSQCYIDLRLDAVEGTPLEFKDLMGPSVYVRDRHALLAKGMYFDLPGYGFHIFDVRSERGKAA